MKNKRIEMNQPETIDFLKDSNFHLFLSHVCSVASIGGAFAGMVTKSNVAWLIGIIAGCFSIYASYLSAKEKRLSIEKMNRDKHIKRKP